MPQLPFYKLKLPQSYTQDFKCTLYIDIDIDMDGWISFLTPFLDNACLFFNIWSAQNSLKHCFCLLVALFPKGSTIFKGEKWFKGLKEAGWTPVDIRNMKVKEKTEKRKWKFFWTHWNHGGFILEERDKEWHH